MPIISYHPPSHGRGMPEGQGVGRRRKRAKPTSGATRHLLPEEGGRNRMSNPSTPFPWKGDARRAGGWPKAKKSEANLRRYAPPPSRGRRENAAFPASSFRAEARNLFRSRSGKSCEGSGERETPYASCDWGSRASCRWIYEGKQQTANEKDPSAALGMTKRGNASRPFLFNPEQKPISAPKGRRFAA